ncbi:hypothetical protein BBO99_00007117 [Phytophthora kernoviae]|uniref:RxLR effector protein n=1 Tax=Phytophthora kernoviae TaxID=325452 RepID=A0A3R7KH64_9STRA|nr:hypothetical protein JM16_006939 [Phytophthora kernoviae]RLN20809.1 hypothetical protein BBI17_007103 [Phytophthora kernoviae]RLN76985.1 hypothetical protein BBO99_00007117 [Phytophthora kernoviae]
MRLHYMLLVFTLAVNGALSAATVSEQTTISTETSPDSVRAIDADNKRLLRTQDDTANDEERGLNFQSLKSFKNIFTRKSTTAKIPTPKVLKVKIKMPGMKTVEKVLPMPTGDALKAMPDDMNVAFKYYKRWHEMGVPVGSLPSVASMTSSAREFNNIPARSREQREAVCDKEQREKERLRVRKEGFVRVDTSVTGSAMLVYTPQSQGFMSDADRFHTDTAGEERVYRNEARTRVKMQDERRRQETVSRDMRRWEAMDASAAEERRRGEALRASGSKARRNKCGEPFNPITLKYNDGKDGERLQAADTAIKHRAMVRAQNLQHHNSREGINPITGDPIRRIQTRDLLPPPQ